MSDKKCKWTVPNRPEYECKQSLICGDCEYNTFNPLAIKYEGHEYEAIKDGIKYKSTDGKNWVQDCKNTEVQLTRRKPYEYIKGILSTYGAEHLIDLPESMRLLVLQSLEEIIVNERYK